VAHWKNPDAHGHGVGSHSAHGPERFDQTSEPRAEKEASNSDVETGNNGFNFDDNALAQIIGVAILEFGVVLHRCGSILSYAQR